MPTKPIPPGNAPKNTYKYMQVLDRRVWNRLAQIAKKRGVTVQELLRVEVIPRYLGLASIYTDVTRGAKGRGFDTQTWVTGLANARPRQVKQYKPHRSKQARRRK